MLGISKEYQGVSLKNSTAVCKAEHWHVPDRVPSGHFRGLMDFFLRRTPPQSVSDTVFTATQLS